MFVLKEEQEVAFRTSENLSISLIVLGLSVNLSSFSFEAATQT